MAWLGNTDLKASEGVAEVGLGPIAQAVQTFDFDAIVLISNHPKKKNTPYESWLKNQTSASVEIYYAELSRPTHYEEIYKSAVRIIEETLKKYGTKTKLTFHLSPGTPAMTAIWIILAKTRFQAALIESSREEGVRKVNIPFEIAAEFIPDLLRESDKELQRQASAIAPETPAEFDAIIHRSTKMKKLIAQAQKVAVRSVPVIIEGESGTGKELLARAIHQASPRRNKTFVTVNCGAIPSELVESEFFGHTKGAFTGAVGDRVGYFEQADGGTIFLDEIGELPLSAQVKLLRVLQEGEVIRVGSSQSKKIDVRVISATNKNLPLELVEGRFREDLFYRLAVIILTIPALRERDGDLSLLIDALWQKINNDAAKLGIENKKLSAGAKNALLQHQWIGNVRELQNTLTRLAITTESATVSKSDAENSLLKNLENRSDTVLNRLLADGFSLNDVLSEVSKHYLERALQKTHGQKTAAARLLGFNSYQTLKNWAKKYNIE